MNAITRLEADGTVRIPQDVIEAAHLRPGVDIELEVLPQGFRARIKSTADDRTSWDETLRRLKALKLYDGPPRRHERGSAPFTAG